MAHHHLGDQDQAREWYAKAVAKMDEIESEDEKSLDLQAEAAELLNVNRLNTSPTRQRVNTVPQSCRR
jgi:hypothetical protein